MFSSKLRLGGICLLVIALQTLCTAAHGTGGPADAGAIDLKDIDINELLKDERFADLLPPEFRNVTLPKLEDVQKIIKDKCSRVAGSDASYEEAEQAAHKFGECMRDLVDFSDLEEEIKKAKPTGDLDTVFNKYCRRRSAAIECIDTFSTKVDVCLENDEKESKVVVVNIVHGLLNFVCHKDGDQIALFIAEEGPECFSDQKDALMDCINGTLSGYLKEETAPVDTKQGLPKLVMGKKQCNEMDQLQSCMVEVLEGCKESTPANLVESLFKFVRRETPCVNMTTTEPVRPKFARGSSDLTKASVQIMISTLLMGLVAKMFVR
ncbi:27 kDa hemolymph protein-like [Anopheles cruzii]|uniref:27 kDa hemolymph protein-like n=1 Tax=Anopheles cruzii TaxID=68878 RepID=UPI0022EC730A|nr:27 kDa hemolymph protein-like [Anopheles cruzii]XP_052872844.1 27 kDa hemolymph protein-like [Anopheles cruzii]